MLTALLSTVALALLPFTLADPQCALDFSPIHKQGKQIQVTFVNDLDRPVDLCWAGFGRHLVYYQTFEQGQGNITITTYDNHPWILTDKSPLGHCKGDVRAPAIKFDQTINYNFSTWVRQCGIVCSAPNVPKRHPGPPMTFDLLNDDPATPLDLCFKDATGSYRAFKRLRNINETSAIHTLTRREWALFQAKDENLCAGDFFVKPFSFLQSLSTKVSELKGFCSSGPRFL